ncbi:glutamate--tRNA ligase [Beijerinckia sp. L45]|uniref:glutamate--tRNA ligase n=1 Tax=Beijerinckia sp. L45 TaxID=1641855 RepID=UPI00131AE925|nr:glutamate--tRNA ligase [Beijerinckia sp. L45]
MTVVRFAPSPTGRIHIGNARTALLNALFARKTAGRFILRFDDTDAERSRQEYVEAIGVDLRWLGVEPDVTVRQSERFALYAEATERLKAMGRLYPAYETADELDRRRKRQQARSLPPVYDRAALALTAEDRAKLEAEGRRPHWRFKLETGIVTWTDLVRGESRIDCSSLSDPVLIREDGTYLYTLPSVVDDIDLGVTHVIRGEDHVTNTAVQAQLFAILGGTIPIFGHHNLLTTATGEGLSKRSGALSLGGLRDVGIEPLAVAALAVLTGSSDAVHPVESLDALAAIFDFSHISRNPARFDPAELAVLSARTLHGLPFVAVEGRLAAVRIAGAMAEPFWLAVRGNLETFGDVIKWWRVIEGPVPPVTEDPDFLAEAEILLPQEPWDFGVWAVWTAAIKAKTARKGKALFHPLRLALTGSETGPELAALLPLIGRARASARLSGRAA